jgi:hypothetical protein
LLLTREALQVASDYLAYRQWEDGRSPSDVLAELDLPCAKDMAESQAVRALAEHWLTDVAPMSRQIDAERRVRLARRNSRVPLRLRILAGRA